MSQLVQIKDFYFLALKDEVNITDEDRKSFLSIKLKDDFWGPKIVDVVECALPNVVEPTITLGSEDLKKPINVLYNNWP